jgi:6-phosphogluconolactonase
VAGQGKGPTARQAGPHGHAVAFDAANRVLVGADRGHDRLLGYRFDAATGTLAAHTPPSAPLPPGAGPRHFAFHPNGRQAFAINELSSTITSFSWNASDGVLTPTGTVPTRPAGVTEGTTAEIHVHPSGRFVYGSNRGHDSIAVFRVAADAALTLVEHESTRGQTPRNFTIDPTGRWIIAGNQRSNTLAVFSIDQTTGALSPVGPLTTTPSPVSILFMP